LLSSELQEFADTFSGKAANTLPPHRKGVDHHIELTSSQTPLTLPTIFTPNTLASRHRGLTGYKYDKRSLTLEYKQETTPTTQNSILRPPFRTLLNYSPVHHIITHSTQKAPFLSTSHVLQQLRNRPFYPFLLVQEQLKRCTNAAT
jgi:hypothetical protein